MKYPVLIIAVALFFSACKKSDYQSVFNNPQVYSNTVHELNRVVMGNNFSPVVASRNYAYASVAGYEVIAAGYPNQYNSLVGHVNGLKAVAKPSLKDKINFQYASILAFCKVGEAVTFPEGSMKKYTDSLHNLALQHGMPADMVDSSENYAKAVAKSIMKWSKGDNYARTRTEPKFNINDSAGRWVPTAPAYNEAVEPHWGEIRTMAMSNAKQYSVPPPPKFDITDKTSKYYREVIAIKNTGDSLTAEQIHIADF